MGESIARVGVDSAGGVILGGGASTVFCNGSLVAVLGDDVTPHGSGAHAAPTLTSASSTVFANGIALCRKGDSVSCGHTISTGSVDSLSG